MNSGNNVFWTEETARNVEAVMTICEKTGVNERYSFLGKRYGRIDDSTIVLWKG